MDCICSLGLLLRKTIFGPISLVANPCCNPFGEVISRGRQMRRRTPKGRDKSRKGQAAANSLGTPLGAEAAEHERQFREILEFCPAALLVVDEDGRLLFHNAACVKSWDILRRNSIFATLACIGMTSTSAPGSSTNCAAGADKF